MTSSTADLVLFFTSYAGRGLVNSKIYHIVKLARQRARGRACRSAHDYVRGGGGEKKKPKTKPPSAHASPSKIRQNALDRNDKCSGENHHH